MQKMGLKDDNLVTRGLWELVVDHIAEHIAGKQLCELESLEIHFVHQRLLPVLVQPQDLICVHNSVRIYGRS
jgi:hypothetical protein